METAVRRLTLIREIFRFSCWLTTEDGAIYAFVGPALTIITVRFFPDISLP